MTINHISSFDHSTYGFTVVVKCDVSTKGSPLLGSQFHKPRGFIEIMFQISQNFTTISHFVVASRFRWFFVFFAPPRHGL